LPPRRSVAEGTPVPKKDVHGSVLSMLSNAGERNRPPATAARPATSSPNTTTDSPAGVAVESPEQLTEEVPVAAPATAQAAPQRRRAPSRRAAQPEAAPTPLRPTETPSEPAEPVENAPRTHRLDQATANELRRRWLEARRRGEVTISQQDYTGRILALGFAAEDAQLSK